MIDDLSCIVNQARQQATPGWCQVYTLLRHIRLVDTDSSLSAAYSLEETRPMST